MVVFLLFQIRQIVCTKRSAETLYSVYFTKSSLYSTLTTFCPMYHLHCQLYIILITTSKKNVYDQPWASNLIQDLWCLLGDCCRLLYAAFTLDTKSSSWYLKINIVLMVCACGVCVLLYVCCCMNMCVRTGARACACCARMCVHVYVKYHHQYCM